MCMRIVTSRTVHVCTCGVCLSLSLMVFGVHTSFQDVHGMHKRIRISPWKLNLVARQVGNHCHVHTHLMLPSESIDSHVALCSMYTR